MRIDLAKTLFDYIFNNEVSKKTRRPYTKEVMYRSIFPQEILWYFKKKKHLQFWLNFLKVGSKSNIYWDDLKLLEWQIKESYWSLNHLKNKRNEEDKVLKLRSGFVSKKS